MKTEMDLNRAHWDEATDIHTRGNVYGVEEFWRGLCKLHRVEVEELGDVSGKSLLHLQCHFGLDTLSWARAGATVTGVDFSAAAIAAARALAAETGLPARFIESDLYRLPEQLDETFDVVFTSYGVLGWMPDLRRWAEVAAGFVRPGGRLYLAEFHPIAFVFDDAPGATELRIRYPYFPTGEPIRCESDVTYASDGAPVTNRVTWSWPYTLADVVTCLIEAGLRLDFLHEFPFSPFQFWPFTQAGADGRSRLRE